MPLSVFGQDAIVMDSWSTKHGHKFPTAEKLNGLISDLTTDNAWLIQPMEFGSTLIPIAVWNT